ncbi:MAG: hypothetical protein H6624_17625 [Bdellovibrionaceae bacterium]|nr:hypothetical protein [Bdellovibrionales bacterium]MCB9086165.1 hypothetical protein [Pseudobdellovibrionaceae bacterium]
MRKDIDLIELPIKSGKVYVSAFFNMHLLCTFLLAQKYPNIDFIVGGPAVEDSKFSGVLPTNIQYTTLSVAEFLGEKDGDSSWNIELPRELDGKVFLGYTLERFCYWAKCNFCTYPGPNKKREFLRTFVESLAPNGSYRIFLNSPALSPVSVRKVVPQLVSLPNIEYWAHVRSDPQVYRILRETLQEAQDNGVRLSSFYPVNGVEFPSDRMLDWMKKGMTTKLIQDTFVLFHEFGSTPLMALIFGWNNLCAKDISQARLFFKEMSDLVDGRIFVKCHALAAKVGTELFDEVEGLGEEIRLGPFLLGRKLPLNKDQQMLNDDYHRALFEAKFIYINDHSKNPHHDFL